MLRQILSFHRWTKLLSLVVLAGCLGMTTSAFSQLYQSDINRWKSQDSLDAPASGSILFTGDSHIRYWRTLASDYSDYKVIQRGFGGSHLEHLSNYIQDIILPYNPSAIVMSSGTNDLGDGELAPEVIADFDTFVSAVHAVQPDVEIIYLGMMPTPARQNNAIAQASVNTINQAIASRAAANPKFHYVDLPSAFFAQNPYNDPAFTSLFVADGVHLSPQGYTLVNSQLRPELEAIIAPNKVFAPNPNTAQPGSKILFDFGPNNRNQGEHTLGPDANGNTWNNWHAANGGIPINAGEHIGNLVDTTNRPTGIDLTITGGFAARGIRHGGLRAPEQALLGDFAIATATEDYFSANSNGGSFMLDGLNPNFTYNFRFFGSQNTTITQLTRYTVVGANRKEATLQISGADIGNDGIYDGNDSEITTISGIRPDEFGQIFIDLSGVTASSAYLNAMEIRVSVPEPSAAVSVFFSVATLIASSARSSNHN